MWCLRQIEKIDWAEKVTNEDSTSVNIVRLK